jgi:NADH:ubiquinone oxidoreductase subunit 4 (subunit M)
VFLGTGSQVSFKDLNLRERAYLTPIALALLFCGLYPKPMIEMVRPAVLTLLSMVK